MNLRTALIPLALVAGLIGAIALHPGVAYAEPRVASGRPTPLSQGARYTIDPEHGTFYFEIGHMGLSKVHGRLNKFSGKVHEDAKDLTKSSVEFAAQVESIDTGVAARDAHLRAADFFDVAKYPELTFRSTKVVRAKKGYIVTGDLTIKGKTKRISIPFRHFGPYLLKGFGEQPTRIGVVADPITIKRSDFGIGSTAHLPDGTMGASDEVVVRISFEGLQDK